MLNVMVMDKAEKQKSFKQKISEGISKILDDICTEHKQSRKLLETNIEESKDLRSETQDLMKGGSPAVIFE